MQIMLRHIPIPSRRLKMGHNSQEKPYLQQLATYRQVRTASSKEKTQVII